MKDDSILLNKKNPIIIRAVDSWKTLLGFIWVSYLFKSSLDKWHYLTRIPHVSC